jgi:Tfp pilus assembly protein PilV
MSRNRRHGFSLLEVLLATSILIGSAIVLLELVTIGNRHASSARDLARSQLICQTKLAEILAHLAPVETVRPTPVEGEPEWVYWVDLRPTSQSDLVALEVNTAHESAPQKQSARCTLVRWVRDPRSQRPGDAPADAPDTATAQAGRQPEGVRP